MRIIGGRLRGRRIDAPDKGTRPTTDRTREAIFNLIGARLDLDGSVVLDLFAGSGALGIEALSRGARHATFVENHPRAVAQLKVNIEKLGEGPHAAIVRGDVWRFLRQTAERFDLIVADPPYELADLAALPESTLPLLAPEGLFVLEHGAAHDFAEHPSLLTVRTYGHTQVSLFARDG